MRLEVGYDRRVGKAIYAIDNFPDDDLFGVSSGSVAWHTSGGGSAFFTETATKANNILCKYPSVGYGVGFGNMGKAWFSGQARRIGIWRCPNRLP
jgi:hypothetical protein